MKHETKELHKVSNPETEIRNAMAAINRSWRENKPSEMRHYLHPKVTTVLPGFSGTVTGIEAMITGFAEWCSNARVLEYEESDEQIQIVGDVGFVSYQFDMLYERKTYRERSTGRDIWVFECWDGKWVAIWRTMVNLNAEREASA